MSEQTQETPAAAPATPETTVDTAAANKKHLLNHNKLNLRAPSTAQGKEAALVWDFRNNNPRLTVFSRDPNDVTEKNTYGSITANLDLPTFYAFIELLKKAVTATQEFQVYIDNFNFTYEDDVKSETPSKVSELHVGRNAEGQAWVGLSEKGEPKIRFFFAPTNFHFLYHTEGDRPFSKKEVSDLFTKAYISMLSEVLANVASANFVPVEAPPREFKKKTFTPRNNYQQGGNGGGNYNGNNNWKQRQGGGNYQGGGGGGYNRGGNGGGSYGNNNYNRNNNGGGGGYQNRNYQQGGNQGGNSGGQAPQRQVSEDNLPF